MIWIVAAVEAELNLLVSEIGAEFKGYCGGYAHYEGNIQGNRVRLGILGIGMVSAALALGAFMSLELPDQAVMTGTAGAFPGSGLGLGDLVTARGEAMAELGLTREAGIGDVTPLKIPGLIQHIDFDPELTGRLAEAAATVGPSSRGNLLTVAGVSPGPELAKSRARSFKVVAENMEGYALALAGRQFKVKTAEIRSISNQAGDSDKSRWDFKEAQVRSQHAVLRYLRSTTSAQSQQFDPLPSTTIPPV